MLPGMCGGAAGSSASGPMASFIDQSPIGTASSPDDALSSYVIYAAGTDQGDALNTWLLGGANSDFEIYAHPTSGSVTTGTIDTWLAPTTDLTWTKARTSNIAGSSSVNLAMQCRRVSDLFVVDSWSVFISAVVE